MRRLLLALALFGGGCFDKPPKSNDVRVENDPKGSGTVDRDPPKTPPVNPKAHHHPPHEHPHGAHPHATNDHHHHPHPHPHLDGQNGHHHPY
jgi:hypothetical protein